MNKIDKISTAFSIVHTQKEIEKLEDKIFNVFEDLQGLQGPRGFEGDKGEKGDKGPKGDKGIKGDRGDKGERGERGEVGAQGEIGEKGDKGDQGIKGDTGAKGERGEKGDIGLQGLTGPQGERGEKGDKGDKGNSGERGDRGEQGVAGPAGRDGTIGPIGPQGVAGPKGERGERGERGLTGPQGEQGIQGEKGEPGTPAPDYRNEFEEALKNFNQRLTENASRVDNNIQKQIDRINQSLSTIGGGGSYKLVDNADVDKAALKGVVDDAILIYDPTKKKFIADSFVNVLDRLKAELEVQYNKLIDQEGTFYYIGEALPGTNTDQSKWRIKRIEEVGNDYNILWADGTAEFDKIWDDRVTFTYS